jgi:FtsH-binding integral membrane protein
MKVLYVVKTWYPAEITLFLCVQMLMHNLSPEEYILATINLYMDIVNLFIYILRILDSARRS